LQRRPDGAPHQRGVDDCADAVGPGLADRLGQTVAACQYLIGPQGGNQTGIGDAACGTGTAIHAPGGKFSTSSARRAVNPFNGTVAACT
jgi:hypothetical protein